MGSYRPQWPAETHNGALIEMKDLSVSKPRGLLMKSGHSGDSAGPATQTESLCNNVLLDMATATIPRVLVEVSFSCADNNVLFFVQGQTLLPFVSGGQRQGKKQAVVDSPLHLSSEMLRNETTMAAQNSPVCVVHKRREFAT